MLGLLRQPFGQDSSAIKAEKQSNMTSSSFRHVSSSSTKAFEYTSTSSISNGVNGTNGVNGGTYSALAPPDIPDITVRSAKPMPSVFMQRPRASTDRTSSFGGLEQVKEQLATSRNHAYRVLGSNFSDYAFDTSITGLLEWIRDERLIRLPHKGGSWDRVLIAAQHFAEQVHRFNIAISTFESDINAATNLVFGQCLLLLELGSDNAPALETVFNLFYQFGLELSPLLKRVDIITSSRLISDNLSKAFSELLSIVTGVAITFWQIVHGNNSSTNLDIFSTFSTSIESFRSRVSQCSQDMWNYSLTASGLKETHILEALQAWLAPQDTVLAFLASNNINIASRPEQFTCTWFQSHLTNFMRSGESSLVVEGKTGTGKTTLANWTVDRLQRPIGRKLVFPLSFFFNSNIPAQANSFALLKTLLWQILSQRIGDIHLYKALTEAYHEFKDSNALHKNEEILWAVLEKVLSAIDEDETNTLVLVVDGLDEITGQRHHAHAIANRLHDLAVKIPGLRLIRFSQPLETTHSKSEYVKLTTETMIDDIRTIVRRELGDFKSFAAIEDGAQESAIDKLAAAADGSILWAWLATQYIRHQKVHSTFDEALQALVNSPKTVPDLVERLMSILRIDPRAKSLLSVTLAAERPLLLSELELLLQAQPSRLEMDEKSVDLRDLTASVAPFTIRGEGMLTIRHAAIKTALIAVAEKSKDYSLLKDRHRDMLTRILIHAKTSLREDQEPTLDYLDFSRIHRPSHSRQLLEYTVRYWIVHFKQSSLLKRGGDLEVPKDFANIFPSTVTLALLEEACWRAQTSPSEATELHALAYRVRVNLFGQDHACVLQAAIVVAKIYETTLFRLHDAASWYMTSIKVAAKILGSHHDLVVQLCLCLLRVTESLVTKSRSQITTYREETLRILVSAYTYRYGASSREVSACYRQLSELYIFIGETEKTEEFKQKTGSTAIDDQTVQENGEKVSRSLDVTLRKRKEKELIDTFEGSLFAGYQEETAESLTLALVEGIFARATELIKREDYEKAEELYIELWWKLTEHCASVRTLEWHQKKLELMLAYARFLHSRNRVDEASSVLLFAWKEFEHSEFSMYESIVRLLKEIAVIMKVVKLNTVALSVYQKCFSYYKNVSETTFISEIEEQITATSMEIIKSSTTTVSESTEVTIREVFEHTITTTSEVTHSTFELSKSLTAIYIEQSRYAQAITVLESTMKKGWAGLFNDALESITLPAKFSTESVMLAVRLAECYEQHQVLDQSEQIYLRLYRAHHKTHSIDNLAVAKYSDMYIAFLQRHGLHDRIISFYQELLIDYRNFYGKSDKKTITLLYNLADTCRTHHLVHRYWVEYYLEIVNAVNKGELISQKDALRALIIVAEHYYESRRFTEALIHFKSIAATFIKFGTQYEHFADAAVVQRLLEKYYTSMEETKLDVDQHVKILREVREACFKYYGEKSVISIITTSALAEACSKSQEYWFESIRYFETVSQHSEVVSVQTIERSKSMIKELYIKQITSTKSTTLSKETVEKAELLLFEKYISSRRAHEYTQTKTLKQLQQLIAIYHKQQKTDLIIKELRSLILDIVLNVRTTEELVYVADFLATIFISYDLRRHALEIVRDLKLQAIYRSAPKTSAFHGATIGRACFAFIAAFEYHVRSDHTLSIAHNIAELVAEHLFYERFVRSIKAKAKLQAVFVHAARLRHILVRNKRFEDFTIIETQLIDFFAATEVSVSKAVSRAALKAFVNVITKYAAEHPNVHFKSFVVAASYAAVDQLRLLLKQNKDQEALDLATCTFKFLMAHEGLDDPTEIRLGFQLCLMTAGRGEFAHKSSSPKVQSEMLALSQQILAEVFDICKNNNINIARAQLSELNELISLIGEHKDYSRLSWLLNTLWTSREGQSSWPQDTILDLGFRLVQAEFSAGNYKPALRLCEDIVYNIKRVHGSRNPRLYSCWNLLAELYTGYANHLLAEAAKQEPATKKASEQSALLYLRKAADVHLTALKQLVDADAADTGDDDDYELDIGISLKKSATTNGTSSQSKVNGDHKHVRAFQNREEELEIVRRHLRLLKLALQRAGGFFKSAKEYEALTQKVSAHYGEDLKLKDLEWNAAKWKVEGLALGQAEAQKQDGVFRLPAHWEIHVA
ncbi:uncharacterized protein PV07_08095 [Cladophialophora immunda]|uniref:NACHT domain-containing protein n=2 Tax=Cladophialophora immunda TaxID=569365 RepID=A0A0D2CBJ2_9EURO|nr:uncharacterized protein PV07_08095 [Cladophialophora immunda]KIW28428.1 hypothetical protein PV07_08095 [Cladophialophora immunda]